jgi:hypothetical protein
MFALTLLSTLRLIWSGRSGQSYYSVNSEPEMEAAFMTTNHSNMNNPHDSGYKYLLSSKKAFMELIKSFIKTGWAEEKISVYRLLFL